MSDTSQGPGWWQASDAKWYPPESRPDAAAVPAAPAPTEPAAFPETPAPAATPGRRKGLIAGAAVVALALIAGAIVFLGGGSDDPEQADQTDTGDGTEATEPTDTRDEQVDDEPDGVSAEVASGTLVVTPELVGAGLEPLDDATMIGVDYEVTIDESVRTDELPADDELLAVLGLTPEPPGYDPATTVAPPPDQIVAADGEQLVVLRYDLEAGSSLSALSAALDVDGVKESFELVEGPNTIVATVDADAEHVSLAVQDTDTNQTIDVITGELGDDYPRVLYLPADERRVAVNDSMLLPFTATYSTDQVEEGELEIGIGEVELAWSTAHSTLLSESYNAVTLRSPSDPEHAWLVVEINRFESTLSYLPDLSPSHVVLVLDDGTEIQSRDGMEDILVFEVPVDTAGATLRVEPGDNVPAQTSSYIFNFGGIVGEIDIDLGGDVSSDEDDDETTTTTED